MNAKKSGLADSPFFRPAEPATPPLQPESLQMRTVAPVPESVPVYTDAQSHERTPAHIHNRANEPMRERSDTQTNDGTSSQAHERTITQMNASTDAHLHERTDAQPTRPRTRETYDVYEDQAQAIQELQLKWGRERRKHITKGLVMRELLDEILPKK